MPIPSLTKLQKKADETFSKYIRKRDCANHDGTGRCCTCKRVILFETADACHFVSRQYLTTRYDDRNVHAGCRQCNRFLEGNKDEYALFLLKKYGPEIIEELNKAKWQVVYAFDYQKIIDKYK